LRRPVPRELLAGGTIMFVALAGLGAVAFSLLTPGDPARAAPPPTPPEMAYRQVDAAEAMKLNAQLPVTAPIEAAAKPFYAIGGTATKANATECLTSAIYYEAAQESTDGQRAVAQVVLNRVRHPAFPSSVCGVIYQGSTRQTGCQFTFTCDGSLARAPVTSLWNRARKVAQDALNGSVYAGVGNATHYHANYVMPYWAPTLAKTQVVGAHIFYRWNGAWGRPAAFRQSYSGHEANPAALRSATLAIVRTIPESPAVVAAMPIAKVEGVTVREEENGKRVRVLFTPQAREAVEKATEKRTPYVERVQASESLRAALGGGETTQGEAFGRATSTETPPASR
jgi:spore germination cell wall hydrolase CwlJ-like protein